MLFIIFRIYRKSSTHRWKHSSYKGRWIYKFRVKLYLSHTGRSWSFIQKKDRNQLSVWKHIPHYIRER